MPFIYCFYPFILFPEPEFWMKYDVNSNVLRIQEINLNVKGILNSVQNEALQQPNVIHSETKGKSIAIHKKKKKKEELKIKKWHVTVYPPCPSTLSYVGEEG